MTRQRRPQPATIDIAPLAPPPFRSLSSDLQRIILEIAEQLAIEAAAKYVEGLEAE